ncbi:hypothetical protein [Frigidibacter sp. MR17.24]|uniref:hypothetical protein n=1 Tax=Frigidibacter sp. MR17.24 TaxID=3127345 RepID=UPI0030130800
MRLSPLLALPLILAACATPQERCIGRVTRDLDTLDRLIAETRANVSRGFGYETYQTTRTRWVQCWDRDVVRGRDGRREVISVPRMCLDDYVDTVERPVAIDIGSEQRKLDEMVKKRAELAKRSAAGVQACRVQYPG